MNVSTGSQQGGVAVLEAAGWFLVLSLFFVGGFSFVDYLFRVRSLSSLVDAAVYDNAVRPYRLMPGTPGGAALNRDDLLQYMQKSVETLGAAVEAELGHPARLGLSEYRVEGGYFLAHIDSQTGRLLSLEGDGSWSTPRGSFGAIDLRARLRERFETLGQAQGAPRAEFTGVSAVAIPTGYFLLRSADRGVNFAGAQFVDSSVAVGIAAAVSLERQYAGEVMRLSGQGETISDLKLVWLRGEFEE